MLTHSSSPGAEKKQRCIVERLQEEGPLQAKAPPEPQAPGMVWGSETALALSSVCAILQILLPH